MTFTASVVQIGKASVRLLFSSLFFLAHENIDTHADKNTLVPCFGSPEFNSKLCVVTRTSVRPVCVRHSSCDFLQWDTLSDTVKSVKCVGISHSHLALLGVQFFGRPLLLGLPQVTGDGDGINAGRHGFGWDLAELLPVRVVLVQAFDHLGCDAPRPDAGQFGDLLCLGAVSVHRPELASGVTEQHQEVIGFRFLHFLQKIWKKKVNV